MMSGKNVMESFGIISRVEKIKSHMEIRTKVFVFFVTKKYSGVYGPNL